MAATVRSVTSNGEENTPTVSVSKPAGLTAGDLMLAFQLSDADGTLGSMLAPSGFVEIGSQAPTAGTNIPAMKVWRKVATSTDAAASTFDFPDNTGSNCSVVLAAITEGTYDTTTPTSTPAFVTQGDASSSSVTAPSITGSTGALLLCGFGPDTGGTVRTFSSGPAGMTLVEQSAAGTASYTRLGVYSQVLAADGSTGVKTATLSATPAGFTSVSLQVLPASGGGGDTAETFGNIADGGTDVTQSSTTKISISSASPPSGSGTLDAGHAHVWVSGGSSNTRLVVYADNGSGAPGARLAVSDEVVVTGTTEAQRDYTFSGTDRIAIVSGTTYWLGIMWSDPGAPNVVHSRGGIDATRWERSASAAPTWTYPNAPNPFGTPEGPFTGPTEVWVGYLVPTGPEGGRFMISSA